VNDQKFSPFEFDEAIIQLGLNNFTLNHGHNSKPFYHVMLLAPTTDRGLKRANPDGGAVVDRYCDAAADDVFETKIM
jgi:hypothetical protein